MHFLTKSIMLLNSDIHGQFLKLGVKHKCSDHMIVTYEKVCYWKGLNSQVQYKLPLFLHLHYKPQQCNVCSRNKCVITRYYKYHARLTEKKKKHAAIRLWSNNFFIHIYCWSIICFTIIKLLVRILYISWLHSNKDTH